MSIPITDPQQINFLINSVDNWYHKMELYPEIVTPGIRDCDDVLSILDSLGLPKDCQSIRVLDIGCRDGFFSFEMEARGAEVIAIDYAGVDVTGFSVASKIKNSKVKYFTENVYQLDPKKYGFFDVVLFLGVLYHLRHPMFALDQIRKLIKPDGLLLIETQIATNYELQKIDAPAWQFYPGMELKNEATNKWAPNISGLKAVVDEAQFRILDDKVYNDRAYLIAKAETDHKKEYFRQLDISTDLFNTEFVNKKQLQIAQTQIEELKNVITAMESSKLWKLRRWWFALKKKINQGAEDQIYQKYLSSVNKKDSPK